MGLSQNVDPKQESSRIRITVIRIESDTVKIGIEAPKEIHVFRSEIYPGRQSYLEARRDESGSLIPDMIDRTTS